MMAALEEHYRAARGPRLDFWNLYCHALLASAEFRYVR